MKRFLLKKNLCMIALASLLFTLLAGCASNTPVSSDMPASNPESSEAASPSPSAKPSPKPSPKPSETPSPKPSKEPPSPVPTASPVPPQSPVESISVSEPESSEGRFAPDRTVVEREGVRLSLSEFAPLTGEVVFRFSGGSDYVTEIDISPISEEIHDFQIVSVMIDPDTFEFRIDQVLDEYGTVPAGTVVKAKLALMDIDLYGISYTDSSGVLHAFTVNTDGRDGSLYTSDISLN